MVCCERYLVDKLVPGTRVTITGVYTVLEKKSASSDMKQAGLKIPYIVCYSRLLKLTKATLVRAQVLEELLLDLLRQTNQGL